MELILASEWQTEIGFKRHHNLLESNLLKMGQSCFYIFKKGSLKGNAQLTLQIGVNSGAQYATSQCG